MALAFVACEQTIQIGGTAVDIVTKDSIAGIEMGLYLITDEYTAEDPKWSKLELVATATTNSDGFFSMEVDEEIVVGRMVYRPLPPIDTVSINAQYTSYLAENLSRVDFGTINCYELGRSSNVTIELVNFEQEEVIVKYAGGTAHVRNFNFPRTLQYDRPLTGAPCKFNFYTAEEVYLGSATRYLKTQLPTDSDDMDWLMPVQEIEFDYNALEK